MRRLCQHVWLFIPAFLLLQTVISTTAWAQVQIHESVPAMIAKLGLKPVSSLDTTIHLTLTVALPLQNQMMINQELHELYDPASPSYHHYLTHQQVIQQFSPTTSQYDAVKSFLAKHGFKVTGTHPDRLLIDVKGKVSNIQRVFKIKMHQYYRPNSSEEFYAPSTEPQIPASIPISCIGGLSNYRKSFPYIRRAVSGNWNGSEPGSGAYLAQDIRNAYIPNVALEGAGETVGLLEESGVYTQDIQNYESRCGLPNVTLDPVLIDGATGAPNSGEGEVALDIDMALAMAPHLSKIVLFEIPETSTAGQSWPDLLDSMAAHPEIKQFSSSWGFFGSVSSSMNEIFEIMALQGQSFFQASGDGGAFTGSLPGPDDDTLITVVGGTELTMNGVGASYKSETVWNSGYEANNPQWYTNQDYWGSSGGISTNTSIPSYQQSVNMAYNQGSSSMRNVPDVAMVADGVWTYIFDRDSTAVQGTSIAAPLWAGFTALINEQEVLNDNSPIGFLNPGIYAAGYGEQYSDYMHPTASGNNEWPESPSRYYINTSEPANYDLATGWGSPQGTNLIDLLTALRWSNYVTLDSNYTIPVGDTVTILPGTVVKLAGGVTLTCDGTLDAEGASDIPIYFEQATPGSPWNTIQLNGNGNQLSGCVFDGGTNAVSLDRSSGNTFSYCTFEDATGDGLYTGGSSSSLDSCTFQDNQYGVYMFDGTASITHSTIASNTGVGLYMESGTISNFNNNVVEDNGRGVRQFCKRFSSSSRPAPPITYAGPVSPKIVPVMAHKDTPESDDAVCPSYRPMHAGLL